MTDDELFDLLTELEETVPLEDKPARFEQAASELDVGVHGRASLLIAAGEHWQMSGAFDEARRCFELARADGGESATDPLANLCSLALELGDETEATRLIAELRALVRAGSGTVSSCLHLGETLASYGRLREAHRWFTIPLTWAQDEGDLDYFCLIARHRVRRELGLPPDRLDVIAEEERAAQLGD